MRKLKLTPLPTPKWPAPVQVPLDKLPDEIKMSVSEGNVESIVYYESGYGMQVNYNVT